ncbi:hypothetical protein FVE85_5476 [Porphyridium purpureum]|uniref:Uncharacterized protein n=1 Tax=Porphyridium purpureum TaxID=35688 RepID=A0A5J4Z208_PORPP|nr:hypothetical protein FVE85_5476 [Porphyridium purpureum]|eukprot:POR4090..scf295_1
MEREAQIRDIEQRYGFTLRLPSPDCSSAKGLTVLLGGAAIHVSEYESTIRVLVDEKQYAVIAFNRLVPRFFRDFFNGKTHEAMARDVVGSVTEVMQLFPFLGEQYCLVGHSVGGKVALLVASKYEQPAHRVKTVLALDPVDGNPLEFTCNPVAVPLQNSHAALHLTLAEVSSSGSPEGQNAEAIRKACTDPSAISSFTVHRGAGHLCCTDHGGGWLAWAVVHPKGEAHENERAKANAHDMIRKLL